MFTRVSNLQIVVIINAKCRWNILKKFGNAHGCFWREAILNNNTLARSWELVYKILGMKYKNIKI